MYLALIKKELREVLPIAVVAGVAYLLAITAVAGMPPLKEVPLLAPGVPEVPFAGSGFLYRFNFISICFLTAMGFSQSLTEDWRGTYRFLLHRPLPRSQTFAMKILVGSGLYLAIGSAAILLLALWAATPRRLPAPFFWSMTIPSWLALVSNLLVYLGAILGALRLGRWFGSRLFPWFASLLVLLIVPWIPGRLPIVAAMSSVFVSSILWTASQRDFS